MARFLISVLDTSTDSATADEMAAIDAFNERLEAEGHWVLAVGLAAPDSAVVIDGRIDPPVMTDGPRPRSPEYVSGFWIIEAPHHEAALRLAAEGSRNCNRRVELRALLGG